MTFQIGEQVRVTRRGVSFDENGMGTGYKWWNCWVNTMDLFIGGVFTIADYDQETGYQLQGRAFRFPENILERVGH